MSTSGWWIHLMALPVVLFSQEPCRRLKWLVSGRSPTATRKSTKTKFESKAHKITVPTFMFANGLQKPQWGCAHLFIVDGSVIENCCGAVALVSHFWIIAKPPKHKKPTSLVRYSMKFKTWVFQIQCLVPLHKTGIPSNWDIQLTSTGHSQFLFHLLIFLRNQGGTLGWKGHYPPAFLAWQGGEGWVGIEGQVEVSRGIVSPGEVT